MADFEILHAKHDKTLSIRISGPLSEDSHLPSDLPLDAVDSVTIDLEHLGFINSYGIKGWSAWIEGISEKLKEWHLALINCPNLFIDAANLTRVLIPKCTRIESFQVPYYSNKNHKTVTVTLTRGIDFEEATPEKQAWYKFEEEIVRDGETFEIDILPQHYFGFLKRLAT